MSAVSGPPAASGVAGFPFDTRARTDLRLRTVATARRVRDRAATVALCAALVVAAVPLVAVVVVLVAKGARWLSWDFFTTDIPRVTGRVAGACEGVDAALREKYGLTCGTPRPAMGPAILGTLLSTGLAALIAIPVGVAASVYLNEIGQNSRTARVIRFLSDVMTGIPSIVMGLFVYTVWVVRFGTAGPSAFAAALALACLMLPIVVRGTEEVLRLVPDELRHANVALGGRGVHGVLRVVLPCALPGITTAALLAVARAAGETAPVLFTIGMTYSFNAAPWGPNTTLAQQIFEGAKSGDPLANRLAWSAALTLVVVVFSLSAAARFIANRYSTRLGG